MNLKNIITDPKTKAKIVSLYGNQYRPASYIYFPVSGKSITPTSQKRQSWFERSEMINTVLSINGELLKEILKIFGFRNLSNIDLSSLSSLFLNRTVAEFWQRQDLTESEVFYIMVKENPNKIDIAVILETGGLEQSSHTEPYHVIFDDDLSHLDALTKEVRNGR
jgi:hypothetical protein